MAGSQPADGGASMVRSVYRTSQTSYVQGTPSPVLQTSGFTYDDVYRLTQTLLDGGGE